jgi:RimJ/RimL family protein N-acetyltransferase
MMDFSNYFWQGKLTRLTGVQVEDAELALEDRYDSPGRQLLQGGVELSTTLEEMREKLAKYANCADIDGLVLFSIRDLADQRVGTLSLHSRNPKDGVFSFGVSVALPYRGKGYSQDAVRLLLKYGFWEQRYHKCNSACLSNNPASIRMHENLGFLLEGLRRQVCFMNGQYYDEVLFGMTQEEFDAREGTTA